MRRLPLVILALVGIGVGAASAQDIRYNFAKDAKFSDFKTYKWVEIKGADQINQITRDQIIKAIDSQLALKGLTKTDADTADLLIGMQTAIGTEKQYSSYSTGWGAGPGWYGGGWYGAGGMQSTTTSGSTSTIYIGQLVIDMYDAKDKDLVWRGTASKTINPKAKPEKQEKNINKAVEKLLKKYPPEQK